MPRPPDALRRQELLDALLDTFARDGIGNRSLRDVAEAVGTSHRMLLHHFGSREELLLTVVEEVERRQMEALGALPLDPAGAFTAMWADLRRPELRPFERLFFECYARAAQGEAPFDRLLPGAVDGWLAQVAERAEGPVDDALTRLGLAVTRGRGGGAGPGRRASRGTRRRRADPPRPGRHPRPAAGPGGHRR